MPNEKTVSTVVITADELFASSGYGSSLSIVVFI